MLDTPWLRAGCYNLGGGECPGTTPVVETLKDPFPIPGDFLLQQYFDGTSLHCRLEGGGQTLVATLPTDPIGPADLSSIDFTVQSHDIDVDYVRLFEGP